MSDDKLERLDQSGLEKLRQTVEHCTVADIAEVKEGALPEVIEDINAYLRHFAKPKMPHHQCLRCECPLTGGPLGFLLGRGGFEWGIAHGHGHCRRCGWPATAHHTIKDRSGEALMTVRNLVLQQHPDDIEIKVPS